MPIAAPPEVPKEEKPLLSTVEILVVGTSVAAAITAIALALRGGSKKT